VAFHNPRIDDDFDQWGPDERVRAALDVLASMVDDLPDPVAATATDWRNDPWSLGSYSYIPLGGASSDMTMLGTPGSDRLLFAGEHTVPEYFGTVHAAYVSGRSAAQQVLDLR
jgi:monoamine oxidase